MELVLREDLREAVGALDRCRDGFRLLTFGVAETAGVEDVRSQPELLGGFLGDRERVAGDHLDRHAEVSGGGERRFRVFSWRVKEWQYPYELPRAFAFGTGDAQRPKAAGREFVDRGVDAALDLTGVPGQLEDHLRRALGHLERGPVWRCDGRLGAFTDRVERLEMDDVICLQSVRVLDAVQDRQIDRVVVVGA